MRFTLALWCSPPLRSARGFDVSARAASRPSIHASATPPSPPPECDRKSRREKAGDMSLYRSFIMLISLRAVFGPSIDKHELVAVQQHAAGVRQTVFRRVSAHRTS